MHGHRNVCVNNERGYNADGSFCRADSYANADAHTDADAISNTNPDSDTDSDSNAGLMCRGNTSPDRAIV